MRTRSTPVSRQQPTPPALFVCGYPNLWDHISTVQPHLLISILGQHDSTPWPVVTGIPHLHLEIDDVHRPCNGFSHATPAHIRRLVTFLQEWHPERGDRLLTHCWAGSSRSTAAALIAMAVKQPGREMEAARMLRQVAPQARPNGLMVGVADELMGLGGRLVAAVAGMPEPRGVAGTDLIRVPGWGWHTVASRIFVPPLRTHSLLPASGQDIGTTWNSLCGLFGMTQMMPPSLGQISKSWCSITDTFGALACWKRRPMKMESPISTAIGNLERGMAA